jgi:hypothetical protein
MYNLIYLWEVEDNELWGGMSPDEDNLLVDYNIDPLEGYERPILCINTAMKEEFEEGKAYIHQSRCRT